MRIDVSEIDEDDQTDFSTTLDLQQYRDAKNYESRIKVEYSEIMMDLGKKVINFIVSE